MKFRSSCKAAVAGMTVLTVAGVASAAADIPFTYSFGGGASGTLGAGPWVLDGAAGSNHRFTPVTPLTFGQIGHISADFEVLDSSTIAVAPGSPRITFRFDLDSNGSEDGRAVLSFFLIDATSTQDETDDVVPTGNVIGLVGNSEFEYAFGVPGADLDYAEVIGTIGGYNVLDFFFANDTPGLNVQFSNVVVQYAEIPEPASIGLLAIGAGAMLLRRRKA